MCTSSGGILLPNLKPLSHCSSNIATVASSSGAAGAAEAAPTSTRVQYPVVVVCEEGTGNYGNEGKQILSFIVYDEWWCCGWCWGYDDDMMWMLLLLILLLLFLLLLSHTLRRRWVK